MPGKIGFPAISRTFRRTTPFPGFFPICKMSGWLLFNGSFVATRNVPRDVSIAALPFRVAAVTNAAKDVPIGSVSSAGGGLLTVRTGRDTAVVATGGAAGGGGG